MYKLATHLDAQVRKEARGDATPLAFAKRVMSETKPLMLIMVVDGVPDQPILSIFPEERVGIVNADKLKGGDDPSAPEMRVMKETWRAIGFVGGLGFSPAENDIMQPLYSLKELDANRYPFIQPMNMARMQKMWKRFGVKKERRIPYQFVDMKEKGLSRGEFDAVLRAVGSLDAMLDENCRDRDLLALVTYLGERDRAEKAFENQSVLKLPIVRNGKNATAGFCPDVWKSWT